MENAFNNVLLLILSKINIPLLLKIVAELLMFVVVLNLANVLINKIFKKIILRLDDLEVQKQYNTVRLILLSVADTVVFLFFGTNILQDIGIDMKPILATAGVFGIAIGFGAKRFVEDVISGLNILLTGQVRVGDVVVISGKEGTVERITLTMILLRAFDGTQHFIRNGLIDIISNRTRIFAYAVFNVTVAYKEDIKRVMDVLKALGEDFKNDEYYKNHVLDDIEVLGLDDFLDSSILIKCRIKTTPQSQWEVKRRFNLLIKEKFDELGIEIPFPQVVVNNPSKEPS